MGSLLAVFGVIAILFLLIRLIERSTGRQVIPDKVETVDMWEAVQLHEDHKTGRNLSITYIYDPNDPTVSDDLREIYNKTLRS